LSGLRIKGANTAAKYSSNLLLNVCGIVHRRQLTLRYGPQCLRPEFEASAASGPATLCLLFCLVPRMLRESPRAATGLQRGAAAEAECGDPGRDETAPRSGHNRTRAKASMLLEQNRSRPRTEGGHPLASAIGADRSGRREHRTCLGGQSLSASLVGFTPMRVERFLDGRASRTAPMTVAQGPPVAQRRPVTCCTNSTELTTMTEPLMLPTGARG